MVENMKCHSVAPSMVFDPDSATMFSQSYLRDISLIAKKNGFSATKEVLFS